MVTASPAASALWPILTDREFWDEAARTMRQAAFPLFRQMFLDGATLGAYEAPVDDPPPPGEMLIGQRDVSLPGGLPQMPFDLEEITGATEEVIRGYTDRWWETVEASTRERMRGVLQRAAAEGLTTEQIIREMTPLFGPERAARIAVSETTNLLGMGAQETYRRAGFTGWVWRTVRDAVVDAICDSKASESDPQFGGTPYPMTVAFQRAHVNCRCRPAPAGRPTVPGRAQPADATTLGRPPTTTPPTPSTLPADTMQMHTTPDGRWTPAREQLHDRIVIDSLSKATPVPEGQQPVTFIMGGGPASGKSTVIKRGLVKTPDNIVAVDSDAIKGLLPEYQQMVARGDTTAAAFAHEESSYLAKRITSEAAITRRNVLLDGTGDSSIDNLQSKVEMMRAGGQRVIGNYVSLDTDLAVELSEARAAATGRRVPIQYIRDVHASISRTLPEAIDRKLFDEVRLFDTNLENNPRLVLEQIDGKVTIHDRKLWRDFLRKGVPEGEVLPTYAWEQGAVRRGQRARAAARKAAMPSERTIETEVRRAAEAIRANETETLHTWLADGTRWEKSEGARASVSIDEDEFRRMRGARVVLHNHPSSSAFSDADILLGHETRTVEMRVASREADYTLRYTEAGRQMDLAQFRDAIRQHEQVIRYDMGVQIRGGDVTIWDANAVHHHILWSKMRRQGLVEYEAAPRTEYRRALYERFASWSG